MKDKSLKLGDTFVDRGYDFLYVYTNDGMVLIDKYSQGVTIMGNAMTWKEYVQNFGVEYIGNIDWE